ncbi:hypothetical protein KXX52_009122, partial [Aspergillus fumigatus]
SGATFAGGGSDGGALDGDGGASEAIGADPGGFGGDTISGSKRAGNPSAKVDASTEVSEVVCSIGAAAKYGVPAHIILAVAQKEGGKPGQWVRNTNATYDVGAMQFNTAYIRTLARYGIGTADVAQAGCYPYDLAA